MQTLASEGQPWSGLREVVYKVFSFQFSCSCNLFVFCLTLCYITDYKHRFTVKWFERAHTHTLEILRTEMTCGLPHASLSENLRKTRTGVRWSEHLRNFKGSQRPPSPNESDNCKSADGEPLQWPKSCSSNDRDQVGSKK